MSTQREVAVLIGHTGIVRSVAFDVSGKYLASGGARGVTCDGGCDGDSDGDCEMNVMILTMIVARMAMFVRVTVARPSDLLHRLL